MPLTFKTTLSGLARSIPQLTQIYMYSKQYNLDQNQEARLQTESDKRIEKLDQEMKQADDIFLDEQERVQEETRASGSRADASNALRGKYDADTVTAGWDNKILESQFNNSVKANSITANANFELDKFSKLRNPSEQDVLAHNEKMELFSNKLHTLSGDFGYLTKKDELEFASAETMLTLTSLFGSASDEANQKYMQIVDKDRGTIRDVMKILNTDPVFRNNAIKAGSDKREIVRRENAKALDSWITEQIKAVGLDKRLETDGVHTDKDGDITYHTLKPEETNLQRDSRDAERTDFIYELARKGVPHLAIPPMEMDVSGRIYDDLFYDTWYFTLPPNGAIEWVNNHPETLEELRLEEIRQRQFPDRQTFGEDQRIPSGVFPGQTIFD